MLKIQGLFTFPRMPINTLMNILQTLSLSVNSKSEKIGKAAMTNQAEIQLLKLTNREAQTAQNHIFKSGFG